LLDVEKGTLTAADVPLLVTSSPGMLPSPLKQVFAEALSRPRILDTIQEFLLGELGRLFRGARADVDSPLARRSRHGW
jgi:hypothetical protein